MRHFISYIVLVLLVAIQAPCLAQDTFYNYVSSEVWLDSLGTNKVTSVQYYDGLGRPSVLARGGVNPDGKYLYSLTEYDNRGREQTLYLPGVGGTAPDYLSPATARSRSITTNGNFPLTTMSYDVLGRVTGVTRPGEEWHQNQKQTTKAYILNGENDVRKYRAITESTYLPVNDGYHAAGTLTGEVTTDEDGQQLTVFTDLAGRKVLERRGGGNDTYFLYAPNGMLRFVLQPKFQEQRSKEFCFIYKYDNYGRVIRKTLPGCDPIDYRYDRDGRLAFERDGRLNALGLCRFHLYDPLGRVVLTGTTSYDGIGSLTNIIPVAVTTTLNTGAGGICGTGYPCPQGLPLTDITIEEAIYYDSYGFLNAPVFSGATLPEGTTLQGSSESYTQTLLTGRAVSTSSGTLLLTALYYDKEGRVTDQRETLPDGRLHQVTTSYTYTGNVRSQTETLYESSGDRKEMHTANTYSPTTDKLQSRTVSEGTFGVATFTENYTYDELGRLCKEAVSGYRETTRTYDMHGWPTHLQTVKTNGLYGIVHEETLKYTDGAHPCYNGNISAVNTSLNGTWKGFSCEYDSLGRLTRAEGAIGEQMNPLGIDAMEELTYDANGNITVLSRYGKTDTYYGQTDNMQIAYTGNRITSVYDVVGQPVFAGSFGFTHGTGQYRYDKTGSLTCDGNRGIALIDYDNQGHPTRIQFTDGSVTSYEYTADGRRLKTKHQTAVEGITVNVNTRHELTNAETLAKDSTEYLGNFRYRNNQYDRYEFPGGYATPKPSYAVFDMDFHFYVKDHLGSNVMVLSNTGIEQQTRYYLFGGIVTHNSTNNTPNGNNTTEPNHNKYTGKEFDRMHGLDWYDYVARQYDPVYGRFTSIDPLCEKYPYLSPYAYCGNNPIRFIDPDGREPIYNSNGVYLGSTTEGFTGEVLIYLGLEDIDFKNFSRSELEKKYPHQIFPYDVVNYNNSLEDFVKSSIWTHIVSQFEGLDVYGTKFSLSSIFNNIIYSDSKEENSWTTEFYKDSSSLPIISGSGEYNYETSVENTALSIIVHEWYSHAIKHYGDQDGNHRHAYENVINFKNLWEKSTDSYKTFNLEMLKDYTRKELKRNKLSGRYQKLYDLYCH